MAATPPWTLPIGLFGCVHCFGRPGSRRRSWLAASARAWPMASASIPSASASATSPAPSSAVAANTRLENFSTQASSADRVPALLARSLCWSRSFGNSVRSSGGPSAR